MPNKPNRSTAEHGTVARVLRLLASFSEEPQWSLGNLARQLELPVSTTHRLLRLCSAEGFVSTDGGGIYRPGAEYYRVAGRVSGQMPLGRIVTPYLREVTAACREVAILTVLDRDHLRMFFAAKAEPPTPVRYVVDLHVPHPLSWGASGRSLLAFLSQQEIDEVARRADVSPADGRLLDPRELKRSLEKIRTTGFALTTAQLMPEGVGLAVPIFDAAGEVCANVCITTPRHRHRAAHVSEKLALLRVAVDGISRALGHTAVG